MRYRTSITSGKLHIREPGSWFMTLCYQDAKPGRSIAFPYSERELDGLNEAEFCLKYMKSARKHLER